MVRYLFICLLLAACSKPQLNYQSAENLNYDDTELLKRSADTLLNQCSHLQYYLGDVESTKAEIIQRDYGYESEQLGWKRYVAFEMTIKDTTSAIPYEFNAAKQHCYFSVYQNEVIVSKQACSKVCAGKYAQTENGIKHIH